MNIPKLSQKAMRRSAMCGLAVASLGFFANAVTFTRLSAMPLEERWCVASPASAQMSTYLDAGYELIPDGKRAWFYLPKGSVKRDRNRVFWDAGCPQKG